MMRADYDSEANAISIDLVEVDHWDHDVEIHRRGVVALVDGRPANVELLYPDLGIDAPLAAVAERYGLDREALIAAARAALAAPDRPVAVDVGVHRAA